MDTIHSLALVDNEGWEFTSNMKYNTRKPKMGARLRPLRPIELKQDNIIFRDYYRFRSPGTLLLLAAGLAFFLYVAKVLLSSRGWIAGGVPSKLATLAVIAFFAFFPSVIVFRAIRERSIMLQIDRSGIIYGTERWKWHEIPVFTATWYLAEFGYQLEIYTKASPGIRRLLIIDRALTRKEYETLIRDILNVTHGINISFPNNPLA